MVYYSFNHCMSAFWSIFFQVQLCGQHLWWAENQIKKMLKNTCMEVCGTVWKYNMRPLWQKHLPTLCKVIIHEQVNLGWIKVPRQWDLDTTLWKWKCCSGIVHPKMKICWNFTHPPVIQDIDEFVSSSEQIWRNVAFYHLLTNGSSAVNGCRQNESPNSW